MRWFWKLPQATRRAK